MARLAAPLRTGLLFLALLAGSAVAEEEEPSAPASFASRKHLLTDIPEPNDDVDAVHVFPDYPSGRLPSGQPLKILMGFRNNGASPMNVSHIAGSLNAPGMFAFHIANFSVAEVMTIVDPGKEASFEYRFDLDPQIAGHDVQAAFTAFYQDDADMYATTFFNSTISVLDPVGVIDTQSAVVYLALAAFGLYAAKTALAAAGALPNLDKAAKKALGAKKGKKPETSARKADAGNDWLKGTALDKKGR